MLAEFANLVAVELTPLEREAVAAFRRGPLPLHLQPPPNECVAIVDVTLRRTSAAKPADPAQTKPGG